MKNSGFTLIEILISIMIFSIISITGYQILSGVIVSDEITQKQSQKIQKIQRAMIIIENDFMQIIARKSHLNNGQALFLNPTSNIINEDLISFTRLGWQNPLSMYPRSSLQWVSYRFEDNKLYRNYHIYIDPIVGQEPIKKVLLDNVNKVTFSVYQKGSWKNQWNQKSSIPLGIKIEIDSEEFGLIERKFLTSSGYENK